MGDDGRTIRIGMVSVGDKEHDGGEPEDQEQPEDHQGVEEDPPHIYIPPEDLVRRAEDAWMRQEAREESHAYQRRRALHSMSRSLAFSYPPDSTNMSAFLTSGSPVTKEDLEKARRFWGRKE